MPKTMIVPLDGSEFAERAVVPALTLTRQSGAALVLVMSRLGGVAEAESYLRSEACAAGIDEVRILVFDDRLAARSILTLAGAEPDAMVCMATHARGALGEAVFGSVAEEVIRRGDGPIVLVGPSVNGAGRQPFEELIVCLDGSPLADAILSVAMLLARDLELAVWLISVIDPAVPVDVDASSGEDVSESARLQRLARDLESAGVSVNWEVLHERDPASSIARFAGTRPSPLLALTTHGRGGLSRLTAGSVAMSVVHKAECPVVVTRSGHLSD